MGHLQYYRPGLLVALTVVMTVVVACGEEDPAPARGIPTATPYAKVPEPTIVAAGTRTIGTPSTPVATTTPTPTATPASFTSYTVVAGDAMSVLARRFSTTAEAIRAANNLPDDDIRIGQVLRIPAATSSPTAGPPRPTPPPVATDSYVVKPGDTAFGIALAFQVTLKELEQANGVPEGGLDNIRSGATIRVPRPE